MARIRTIKPEFWRSPDVMGLSYFQRLLFIGLWNLADDHGRGNYDPSAIAADLFLTEYSLNPHGVLTDVSCAFAEYEKRDMVTVYHVKKRDYFQIANWRSHQKPNRPTDSKIPTIDQAEYIVHGGLTEGSVNTHGGISEDSLPEQGTGNREQGTSPMRSTQKRQARRSAKRQPTHTPMSLPSGTRTIRASAHASRRRRRLPKRARRVPPSRS
nr:MAG TPA: replisome organizer [Caudoviricetes sp.]